MTFLHNKMFYFLLSGARDTYDRSFNEPHASLQPFCIAKSHAHIVANSILHEESIDLLLDYMP